MVSREARGGAAADFCRKPKPDSSRGGANWLTSVLRQLFHHLRVHSLSRPISAGSNAGNDSAIGSGKARMQKRSRSR